MGGLSKCCGHNAYLYFGDSIVFSYVQLTPHKEWKLYRYSALQWLGHLKARDFFLPAVTDSAISH